MLNILPNERLQMVHVVEIYVVEMLRVRIDVARDRDVDQEERAIVPRAHHLGHVCPR